MSKIAIIDDDMSIRNSVEIVLRANGHVPVLFSDPKHFLATADVQDFDFLLVDNDMPHMTGLELYEWLKRCYSTHPQFILMSGRVVEEDLLAFDTSTVIYLLTKPFSLAKLLKMVGS